MLGYLNTEGENKFQPLLASISWDTIWTLWGHSWSFVFTQVHSSVRETFYRRLVIEYVHGRYMQGILLTITKWEAVNTGISFMPNIPETSPGTQGKLDHTSYCLNGRFCQSQVCTHLGGRNGRLGLLGLIYNEKATCVLLLLPLEKQMKYLYWRHNETKASCNRGMGNHMDMPMMSGSGKRKLQRTKHPNLHIFFQRRPKSWVSNECYYLVYVQNFASTSRFFLYNSSKESQKSATQETCTVELKRYQWTGLAFGGHRGLYLNFLGLESLTLACSKYI